MIRKKQWLTLIACLVLLVVLAGLFVFLQQEVEPADPPIQNVAESLTVYSTDSELLTLSITNSSGTYQVLRSGEDDNPVYRIDGYGDDVPLYSGRLSAIGSAANILETGRILDAPDDYSLYGLDEPAAIATLSFQDGTETTILVGDLSPDGGNVYLQATGDNLTGETGTVYLVPLTNIDHLLLGATDLVSPLLTNAGSVGNLFDRVVLSGRVRQEPINILRHEPPDDNTASTYSLQMGRWAFDVNSNGGLAPLQSLFSLTGEAVSVYPDEEEVAAAGLDDPYSAATVTGDSTFTLLASEPDEDGALFVMREGIPVLYLVNAYTAEWLEVQLTDMMDPFLLSPDIESLASVTLTSENTTHLFQITQADEDSDPTVTLNGRNIPYDHFSAYFQTLSAARILEMVSPPEEEDISPALTLTFHHRDGSEISATFYPGAVRRMAAVRDDGACFLISTAWYDRVLEDLELLQSGRPVAAYAG